MDRCGERLRVSIGLFCLVLFVIGTVQAKEAICRTGCKGNAGHTFKYVEATTYRYKYDGKIEVSLSSAEGQATSTEVKADVLLTPLNDCNQILRLQNVQVIGHNGKRVPGSIPDIEKPIRLNVNDGVIDDSICIADGDNQNSINVKRAIASFFQASLKSGYETDVFGTCPTDSSSHKEGNVLVVSKSKNLNKCAYREHIQQDFLATAFNLNSEIKSSPLLNGEYSANLRIKNGILDQATITEDYLYVPFSVGKNGAKAQVVSKLQYSGSSRDKFEFSVTQPRSIIFENPHPLISSKANAQTILNAVKEVAQTVDVVVGETTAKEFINLLKIVKVSRKSDLLAVYNQIHSGSGFADKEIAKRLYLDALLRSGSGDSVEALLELLKQRELSETDSKLALLGLNFVRHATEGSLNAAVHLLDSPNLPRETYLGIGNIAGRFCRQHSCENNPALSDLTNKLLSKIGSKPTNREQENDVIFALKGLANFHHLNDNILQKLTQIAQAKDYPNRIRVAALETYLADPCKDKLRNSALNILKDIQQDSEVRIKAYLAIAQCPNAKIGNAVKNILEKEPSIQVGGFITSHIRSIRASANPDKALAKQHLGFSLKKHFPIDPRKYSFNGEFSYAIDTLGLAASSEANVIYSQNSWLPRSSSLNLTAEIFGHNFNFLEIETRQENLDRLVEHYFGPKGVLHNTPIKEMVGKGKNNVEKLVGYIDMKLNGLLRRTKRDVTKAEIDHIAKQVQIKTNQLNKDLDVDISLRTFGSEVFFLNVNEKSEKISPEAIIDKIIDQLSQKLDNLKNFEETLRHNLLFLDAELDYPTSLGFPLRLAVEGSATVQVKAAGSVDVRSIIQNPENGHLKLKLIPSANVEVSGRLTLDALLVENGLKVANTLYSSTGADINLSWDKNSGFEFKYSLPVKEQKIISANHEIVFVNREQASHEQNLPLKFKQVKDFAVCLDQLSPFIGLTFCAEINGPNLGGQQVPVLPFPFSGDAKIAISIENDDVSEFRIKHSLRGGASPTHAELLLETVGANHQRKVAVDLQAEYSPEQYVKALFSSPVKTASIEAKAIRTNVEKAILLRLANDNEEYSLKVGVVVSGTPQRAIYKPILEYKTPIGDQRLPFSTEGQIIVETNGPNVKYIFENVKIKDSQREIGVTGNLGRESGVIFGDLKVSNGIQFVALEGRIQLSTELLKYNIKIQNSFNNNADFNLKGELKRQPNQYDSAIQLVHGPDLNTKTSILTITNRWVQKYKSAQDFRFETKNTISYPLFKISGKFELEHTPKSLDYEVEAEYGELKLGSELEAKINEKNVGDYEVEFDLWGLDNKLEVKSRRQVLGNEESKISNTVEFNGKKFEVEGKIKHQIWPHNLDVSADLIVRVPFHANKLTVGSGLKITTEVLEVYQKISSGSDPIIDVFFNTDKSLNANGNVKVVIKNALTVNGKIKAVKGVGEGDFLVDLQNGKRQVKGVTTFNIQPAKAYDLTATLYPSFNKDKKLKLFISTQTKLTEGSIDTKNQVDILGHPLEFNAKGSRVGDARVGKVDGEAELILPGDQYFLLKGNCDHKESNDLLNGQSLASFEYRKNKNAPGRKVAYKGVWKNTNLHEGLFDIEASVSADDSNGQNINTDISLSRTKQGEVADLKLNHKVYGSLLKHPLELNVVGHCNEGLIGQYNVRASCGSENTVTIQGSHDLKNKEKRSGNLNVQLASTSKSLKSLSVDLRGSVSADGSKPIEIEGSANIFADDDGINPGPIIDLKAQGNAKVSSSKGDLQGNVIVSNADQVKVSATYDIRDDKQGGSAGVSVSYGEKTVKVDGSLQRSSDHHYKLILDTQTPVEGFKTSRLSVDTKRSKNSEQVNSAVEVTIEGKTWKSQIDLVLSELTPMIHVKGTEPDGKKSELLIKSNKISSRQYSSELKLLNEVRHIDYHGTVFVNVENLDNIVIKGQVNSPTLNLNKIVFEAHSNGGNNDRKLQVTIKSAGKNLLSGSSSYSAREENGKFIVEGSGTFKVKDETKSGNFKYILQKLVKEKNGEVGTEVSFDAALGNQAIDSEFKITNKHFRFQNSYCEQKKECAYIEVDNKINVDDIKEYNQVLEINLDLRKLGLSHEFGLKAVTNRKGWTIDHTVDAHFQNQEKSKYQYSFFIHPRESGISLTTPKRIIALEAKCNPAKNILEGGRSNGEIAFYLDKKNHANKKTALIWSLDIDMKGKINGKTEFTHPGLHKSLVASINAVREGTPYNGQIRIVGELDVFAQENQKIVTTFQRQVALNEAMTKGSAKASLTVHSKGLGIDIQSSDSISGDRDAKVLTYEGKVSYHVGKSKYDNLVTAKLSDNEVSGLIKILNKELLRVIHKITMKQHEQIFDTEISSYNNNPVVSQLEIKNYNTLTYSVGFKKTPSDKLVFNAGLIPGQIADIRTDIVKGGSKLNLFFATLKLDDANFLKIDHKVDSNAIKENLEKIKEHSVSYVSGMESVGKEWANEAKAEVHNVAELLKKAAPNLNPLKQYYSKEINELKNEILNDKSIREVSEAVKSVLGALFTAISEISEKISVLVEQSAQTVQNTFVSVLEAVEKELIPQVKEAALRSLAIAKDIFSLSLDIVLGVLVKASQIIEQFQPELKELLAAFEELAHSLSKIIHSAYQNARESIKSLLNRITSEIRASPYIEELKAAYETLLQEGLPNADLIINTIRDVSNTVNDMIPSDFIVKNEISTLLDTVINYVEKKLKNQPVDDIATFEKIGQTIAVIAKKLISIVSAEGYELPGTRVDSNTLLSTSYLRNIPHLVAVRFSPINYLLDQDLSVDLLKFLWSLVTTPRNFVPPFPLFGIVVQNHIFTFDGKHITFPGSCNYLLARDAVNGNFTLAGTYKDGLLTSITLADKSDSVTLLKGGKVKLNNANAELPARKPEIAAFRDYEIVTLLSTAGIRVDCTPEVTGCSVHISGFYHGQIKGLLGNGNNEPYDDFTIPNGKIVTSEGDFGNAYKLSSNCPEVVVPKHDNIPENPTCNKLFGWDSSLRLCYPFVPTENFKAACAHGIAAGVAGTEENIAKAYVAACQRRNVPIHVPEHLVKCSNGDKPYSVGDSFSVKLPSKAADIVLIVDTSKSNKDLYTKIVQQLVPELGRELNAKGINDVEFHLITYGGLNQWPSHVTVNGKLTFKGKPPTLKFGDTPSDELSLLNMKDINSHDLQDLAERLKEVLHDLSLATGTDLKARTFSEAENYPFRANALKSIIVVNSEACEVGKLYPLQKLIALTFRNSQISVNLFTPFESLSLKNSKKAKDIVGFNSQRAFSLSQGKKNPKGNTELLKDINYEDYCVDFTLQNRGNAFVNNHLTSLNEADQKQFVNIAASNIIDQLINIEQGLDCECKLVNPYNARNVCKEAYSKDRISKKV